MNNILIVCVGNICRSVTAERIFRKEIPSLNINSAGLAAQTGRGIEKNSAAILVENGYKSEGHEALKLKANMVMESDLILVMEKSHRELIIERYPLARGKVFLLGKWDGEAEIADPYRKSSEMFLHIFDKIQKCCFDWVARISV